MISLSQRDFTKQNSFGHPVIFHPGHMPIPAQLQLKEDAFDAL